MGPIVVLNIMLNSARRAENVLVAADRHLFSSLMWSARKRLWQLEHSTRIGERVDMAAGFHTFLFIRMAASTPYISSRSETNTFHQ